MMIDPGFGIERMTLAAPVVERLDYRPIATGLGKPAPPDVASLIDTLANCIGAHRLYRFAAVESDVPERSVRRIAPLAAPTHGRWPPHWPRPTRLLSPPEPIETLALLPDHPPVQFTWRRIRHRVMRADGPERIYGEWIRGDAEITAVRDYFQVEDEAGQRFWLFRTGDGARRAAVRLALLVPARRQFLRSHRSAGLRLCRLLSLGKRRGGSRSDTVSHHTCTMHGNSRLLLCSITAFCYSPIATSMRCRAVAEI